MSASIFFFFTTNAQVPFKARYLKKALFSAVSMNWNVENIGFQHGGQDAPRGHKINLEVLEMI